MHAYACVPTFTVESKSRPAKQVLCHRATRILAFAVCSTTRLQIIYQNLQGKPTIVEKEPSFTFIRQQSKEQTGAETHSIIQYA